MSNASVDELLETLGFDPLLLKGGGGFEGTGGCAFPDYFYLSNLLLMNMPRLLGHASALMQTSIAMLQHIGRPLGSRVGIPKYLIRVGGHAQI